MEEEVSDAESVELEFESQRGETTPTDQPTIPQNLHPRGRIPRRVMFQGTNSSAGSQPPRHDDDNVQAMKSNVLHEQDVTMNEKYLVDKACRRFLVNCGDVDERIIQSKRFTPLSWIKFREYTECFGKIQVGKHLIVTKQNEILVKFPTVRPVCTFPSCFSTEGTDRSANRRCVLHYGDMLSFAVLELVFKEEVSGIHIGTGIEHVNLMFSHAAEESSTPELLKRVKAEYENSGRIQFTWKRLLQLGLKNAADKLNKSRTVQCHRYWIYDDPYSASHQFYKVAVAVVLVTKLLGNQVIPNGDFAGQHLEVLKPDCIALEGASRFDTDFKLQLCPEINDEQLLCYGIVDPINFCY